MSKVFKEYYGYPVAEDGRVFSKGGTLLTEKKHNGVDILLRINGAWKNVLIADILKELYGAKSAKKQAGSSLTQNRVEPKRKGNYATGKRNDKSKRVKYKGEWYESANMAAIAHGVHRSTVIRSAGK